MDVRARRMHAERRSLDTLIELPICMLVITVLTLVAIEAFRGSLPRLHSLNAMFLAQGPIIASLEYHATTGRWPSTDVEAGFVSRPAIPGKWIDTGHVGAGGSAIFQLVDDDPSLAGPTLSFRLWQTADPAGPIVWRCGHSRAPAPFVGGPDQTTVRTRDLLAACRSP